MRVFRSWMSHAPWFGLHRRLGVLAALCSAGCATSGMHGEPLEMEALEFRARHEGERVVVDAIDAETLFAEGEEAFKRKRLQAAAEIFERLVQAFPEHSLTPNALYNAGLARFELGQPELACPHFELYLAQTRVEGDRVDALLRLGGGLIALERWTDLRARADELLALRLNVLDRVHALALSGLAWQQTGELARAEREFQAALQLHNEHAELPMFRGNYHVAMAHHQIGEIYRALFGAIEFRMPLERMERDLEDKSRLFLKAQSAYLKSVRVKNAHWAIVAGYQIGAIYEEFYQDFLDAETPAELTPEEVEVYIEELRHKTRPLLDRAVEVYERSVHMSERVGMQQSEHAEKARERARALRDLLRQWDEPSS